MRRNISLLTFTGILLMNFRHSVLKKVTGKKFLTRKAPNTTIAEFANTVDPEETALLSHLILIYVFVL